VGEQRGERAKEGEDNENKKGSNRKRLSNKERKDDALDQSPEYIIRTQLILPDLQLGSDNMLHRAQE
jgi:hypothetical protein